MYHLVRKSNTKRSCSVVLQKNNFVNKDFPWVTVQKQDGGMSVQTTQARKVIATHTRHGWHKSCECPRTAVNEAKGD